MTAVTLKDMSRYWLNKRVRLCNPQSVKHFAVANMPITGQVVEVDYNHYEGYNLRPFLICFDDNRQSWYASNEIRRIK